MVDVTGIEPVTPACKLGIEGSSQIRVVSDAPKLTNPTATNLSSKTVMSGVAYTENWRNFRSLKCPEVVPNFSAPLNFRNLLDVRFRLR